MCAFARPIGEMRNVGNLDDIVSKLHDFLTGPPNRGEPRYVGGEELRGVRFPKACATSAGGVSEYL